MARKKKHEEHVNAEAWAIPYGDLVTLLFALFTVMYAMSSVNEGKFRVLSDSLIAAFHGAPKSIEPVNIGDKQPGKGGEKPLVGIQPTAFMKIKEQKSGVDATQAPRDPNAETSPQDPNKVPGALIRMERQVQDAMQSLIDAKLVTVRRESMWLEIEINTDILFPSGAGEFTTAAEPVLDKLALVLKPFTNRIRVEGHTDDRPIRTASFPSNWELSAARAASVVHEFTKAGIDPLRLEIVGFGEFHPRQSNDTVEGRNANRRARRFVRRRNCRCRCRRKSATMARTARRVEQDSLGEGSIEGGCGQGFGCGERFARSVGSTSCEGCAPDPISEVTHERS
jgi:chemotaxis protein MotB